MDKENVIKKLREMADSLENDEAELISNGYFQRSRNIEAIEVEVIYKSVQDKEPDPVTIEEA